MFMLHTKLKGMKHINNMPTNILPLHTSLTPRVGSKGQLSFLKVVILHIKLMGMKHRKPCKQIFFTFTHPRPLDLLPLDGVKTFFFQVMLYKERSLGLYASKMFDLILTPDGLSLVERLDIEIVQISRF